MDSMQRRPTDDIGNAMDEYVEEMPRPSVTSADVERAATLAWNEAVEACAKAAEEEAASWRAVNNFNAGAGATQAAHRIRALKRTT